MVTPASEICEPSRGIGGMIKRYACKIPEDQASRWMLLLVSDRVDELEYQVLKQLKNPWFLLSAAVSFGAALYLYRNDRNAPCSSQAQ